MSLETGQNVRLKAPVIQGPIKDTEYDKDAKTLRHLVEYSDLQGETHQRWFLETDLELVDE